MKNEELEIGRKWPNFLLPPSSFLVKRSVSSPAAASPALLLEAAGAGCTPPRPSPPHSGGPRRLVGPPAQPGPVRAVQLPNLAPVIRFFRTFAAGARFFLPPSSFPLKRSAPGVHRGAVLQPRAVRARGAGLHPGSNLPAPGSVARGRRQHGRQRGHPARVRRPQPCLAPAAAARKPEKLPGIQPGVSSTHRRVRHRLRHRRRVAAGPCGGASGRVSGPARQLRRGVLQRRAD